MKAYWDTSSLLKLYIAEPESPQFIALSAKLGVAIPLSALHQLEIKNALELKTARQELTDKDRAGVWASINADIQTGSLIIAPVQLDLVFHEAHLLTQHTQKTLCRALDILHVAFAIVAGCDTFVTHDSRQRTLAALVGLAVP